VIQCVIGNCWLRVLSKVLGSIGGGSGVLMVLGVCVGSVCR